MAGEESAVQGDRRKVIGDFAVALRQLRIDAGKPTFRAMAGASGAISHTTLHEAASGSRLPSWSTTREYVRACGGDEAQWRARWTTAAAALLPCEADESPNATSPAAAFPQAVVAEQTSPADDGRTADRAAPARPRRLFGGLVVLSAGALLGAGAMLAVVDLRGLSGPSPTEGCPIADATADRSGTLGTVGLRNPTTAPSPPETVDGTPQPVSWVARPASDAEVLSGTEVVLPIVTPVAHGDALIVTLMLTSACPGGVVATDTRGDRFQTVADETDSARHRTMVIAAFGVQPLSTADSIRLSYSHASKYQVAVDEFRGVHSATAHTQTHGEAGGTAFTTSSGLLTCASGDLMISAVGTNTGTAPAFAAGWTTLPVLKLSSYRLTTAYRLADTTGPCAATGTTTAQWGAVLATLR